MADGNWQDRLAQAGSRAERLTQRLRLRYGSMNDYAALTAFHYLRQRPATATRVIVLEDDRPSVIGRFTATQAAAGRERQVVGVLVESMPSLGSVMRNVALRDRYRGLKGNGCWMGKLLNADLRCISRVVVHPQWRGLGLAVRLVRAALATMTTPFTEAMAAMGRVHPFFELAGMRAYRRWPLPRDQRLRDVLAWAEVELWELASVQRMQQRLAAERTGLLRRELSRWADRERRTLDEQLEAARQELLCEPVYYLAERGQAGAGDSQ